MNYTIHQSLHGYRRGHELLGASLDLQPESEAQVLRLSDLSGTGFEPGFEEYYTGYGLKDDDYYVLAKTWYAREMPRPGCVWTHSLYIPIPMLRELVDIQFLIHLFERPDGSNSDRYTREYLFQQDSLQEEVAQDQADDSTHELMTSVMLPLYDNPEKCIVAPAQRSSNYNDVILRIWVRQWASLKADFCFCTGSLSMRRTSLKLFDLQVVPYDRLPAFRNVEQVVILNGEKPQGLELADKTIEPLIQRKSLRASLVQFMALIGSCVPGDRGHYHKIIGLMASLFRIISEASHPEKAVDEVVGFGWALPFLNVDLFGPHSESQVFPGFKERDRLKALLLHSAVLKPEFNVVLRTRRLIESSPADAIDIAEGVVNSQIFNMQYTPEFFSEIIKDWDLGIQRALLQNRSLCRHLTSCKVDWVAQLDLAHLDAMAAADLFGTLSEVYGANVDRWRNFFAKIFFDKIPIRTVIYAHQLSSEGRAGMVAWLASGAASAKGVSIEGFHVDEGFWAALESVSLRSNALVYVILDMLDSTSTGFSSSMSNGMVEYLHTSLKENLLHGETYWHTIALLSSYCFHHLGDDVRSIFENVLSPLLEGVRNDCFSQEDMREIDRAVPMPVSMRLDFLNFFGRDLEKRILFSYNESFMSFMWPIENLLSVVKKKKT